jgi:hypothetical protein
MLPVETELHLQLKVAGERLCFNDLAEWGRQAAGKLGEQLISTVLWEVQVQHAERLRRGEADIACLRCGVLHCGGGVVRRGSRPRKVRTSSGVVVFRLLQFTCRACGGTWSPYPGLLGLEPRCRVSEELLKQLFEGAVQLSYAKSTQLAKAWLGSTVSSRTLHRAVQERSPRIHFTEAPGLATIVADGSLVRAGEKKRGEDYCIAFQLRERRLISGRPHVEKRVIGFGFGRSGWDQAFSNVSQPKLVVTDGEQGLRQCVERYFPRARHQLCEWHVPYTLKFLLLMDGGIVLRRRKSMVARLRSIIQHCDHEGYRRFTRRLKARSHARVLLEGAEPYIMYKRRSTVRTTSWAERQMRELNRRTDVGVRWSLNGVANMLKLRLATLHNRDDYERIWTPPNPLAWNLGASSLMSTKSLTTRL